MKICAVQIENNRGAIHLNIEQHLYWIEKAINKNADLIVFSELSLTNYEPHLAAELAMDLHDTRLDIFQTKADNSNVTILVGAPIKSTNGIRIGILIFQPNKERKLYAKQFLHVDEEPFFVPGKECIQLSVKGRIIALAICYESLLTVHAEASELNQADIYLASVSKSAEGIKKASVHYPKIAQLYQINVVMANAIGSADSFINDGQSGAWNREGELINQLGKKESGLLIINIEDV